jgi:shikimate dehydrogenase
MGGLNPPTEGIVPLRLADLERWPRTGVSLAVVGHPIAHSLSPPMHNAALCELARLDPGLAGWRYHRFDVPPERLAEALVKFHAAGFRGLNLTVPHKVLAFGLVEAVDPAAKPIGAVNTLLHTETGWRGYNTDPHGLAAALRDDLGVGLRGAHVVLLGAGGAARAAAVECLRQSCTALWIGNRTAANRDALLDLLQPLARGIPLQGFDPAKLPAAIPPGAVLINATSAGLRAGDAAPIALHRLPAGLKVFDMIYNPPQTPLLRDAVALGLRHANGLGMLVRQGAASLEIWTGRAAPVDAMRKAASAALQAL